MYSFVGLIFFAAVTQLIRYQIAMRGPTLVHSWNTSAGIDRNGNGRDEVRLCYVIHPAGEFLLTAI